MVLTMNKRKIIRNIVFGIHMFFTILLVYYCYLIAVSSNIENYAGFFTSLFLFFVNFRVAYKVEYKEMEKKFKKDEKIIEDIRKDAEKVLKKEQNKNIRKEK